MNFEQKEAMNWNQVQVMFFWRMGGQALLDPVVNFRKIVFQDMNHNNFFSVAR